MPDPTTLISLAERCEAASGPDFQCAICQSNISMRWNGRGRDMQTAPICNYCENWMPGRCGRPTHGSFRDRRNVMRGFALAEALRAEANRQKWSHVYGRA